MNPNTELLLARAAESRWEDEEKEAYGVEQLREEFRQRLYRDNVQEPVDEAGGNRR